MPPEQNAPFSGLSKGLWGSVIVVGLGSSSLQLGTFLLTDLPIKIPEEEFIRLAFLPEVPLLPYPHSPENKKHKLK